MAKHKQPDRLSQDASAALAAGMSYGKYMATKEPVKFTMPNNLSVPKNKPAPCTGITNVCEFCGKEFTQYDRRHRKFCCEAHCNMAYDRKRKERKRGG